MCKACALERDLSLFAAGEHTEIGERGVTLSGGQKARVSLARTVYATKFASAAAGGKGCVILLDDPFAAVDPVVGEDIFQNVVRQFDVCFGLPFFLQLYSSRTHRVMYSTWRPCLTDADWCLQSGGMSDSRLQVLDLLRPHAVVLVTHHLHFSKRADVLLALDRDGRQCDPTVRQHRHHFGTIFLAFPARCHPTRTVRHATSCLY